MPMGTVLPMWQEMSDPLIAVSLVLAFGIAFLDYTLG